MTEEIMTGRLVYLGDHISTDAILPGRYLNSIDPVVLAEGCFKGLPGDLSERLQPGDVLVAGRNFGCGSSREKAVVSLIAKGVKAIIAQSYSRIFFRNCINNGLPALELDGDTGGIQGFTAIKVDLLRGELRAGAVRVPLKPMNELILEKLRNPIVKW